MKHYDALETRNPQDREAALMAALPAQIANAQRHSAAFAEILNGVEALTVNSRAALSRLPVTRKYELLARQQAQRATDPLRPVSVGPKWPVKTREHVDLWLHGYALLLEDSATVPLFARGYRDLVTVEKNHRGVYTVPHSQRSKARVVIEEMPGKRIWIEDIQALCLRALQTETQVMVSFIDTGHGISAEQIGQIGRAHV